jgi:hypothetical protein
VPLAQTTGLVARLGNESTRSDCCVVDHTAGAWSCVAVTFMVGNMEFVAKSARP